MYKSIQCLRALAALLVVLFHLSIALADPRYFDAERLGIIFQFGQSGVAFFFVLSGFILTRVHAKDFGHPDRLWSYLRKRAVRIYPVYFILFGVAYAVLLLQPETRASAPTDPILLIKSLALIPQDKMVVGGTGAPVLLVAWTLQFEICFYALLALPILNRAAGLVLVPLYAVNLISCREDVCTFPRSFFASPLFLLFGLGMLIALCVNRGWLRLPRPRLIAAVAAAAYLGYALLETLLGQEVLGVDKRLIYGAISGVLLFALVQAEEIGTLTIRSRVLLLLGDASYVLYLIHYPLVLDSCEWLRRLGLGGAVGALVAFAVILPVCLLVAVGFHVWVERPLLRMLAPRVAGSPARRAAGVVGTPAVSAQSE